MIRFPDHPGLLPSKPPTDPPVTTGGIEHEDWCPGPALVEVETGGTVHRVCNGCARTVPVRPVKRWSQ